MNKIEQLIGRLFNQISGQIEDLSNRMDTGFEQTAKTAAVLSEQIEDLAHATYKGFEEVGAKFDHLSEQVFEATAAKEDF